MSDQITREAVESALISAGNKTVLAGGSAAAVSDFLQSNLGVTVGIAIGILGYLTSLYFQWSRDRRERAEHKRRMRTLPPTQPGDLE
jgi:hypothetical protein